MTTGNWKMESPRSLITCQNGRLDQIGKHAYSVIDALAIGRHWRFWSFGLKGGGGGGGAGGGGVM